MYRTQDFLERYKTLEKWATIYYGDEGVKEIEKSHHNRRIQKEVHFFRSVRNILSHNPNEATKPLIELTDEFKERFESLCNSLMNCVSQIYIPYKDIYKREMSDKVIPTIAVMKENCYTYVPVMNGKKVWGVFSESALFNLVGDGNASMINENLLLLNIGKYITEYSNMGVFDFVGPDASIDQIHKFFSEAIDGGRRLDVLYITSTGDNKGDLVGLITIWDISSL